MKKVCTYLLFFIVTFTITPLQQLLKVPVLFEHFFEHKQLDRTISFLDFLSMHYLGEDKDDNDYERDMQLPFKKVNTQQVSYDFHIPAHYLVFSHSMTWSPEGDYSLFCHQDLPASYKGSLFKPPRV